MGLEAIELEDRRRHRGDRVRRAAEDGWVLEDLSDETPAELSHPAATLDLAS